MKVDVVWIPGPWAGRLGILPRPRGGDWLEDEIRAWRGADVDVCLSLLTNEEVSDLELAEEAHLCQVHGVEFLTFPIVDRGVPGSIRTTLALVKKLDRLLAAGKKVAIHCRQGIGRSALIAACLLVLAGSDAKTAFQQISDARGCLVPETREQRNWVIEFARESMPVPARE